MAVETTFLESSRGCSSWAADSHPASRALPARHWCRRRDNARVRRPGEADRPSPAEPVHGPTGRRKPGSVALAHLGDQVLIKAVPETFGGHAPIVPVDNQDRKSTRLNSSHSQISYAVFCLKKKKKTTKIST